MNETEKQIRTGKAGRMSDNSLELVVQKYTQIFNGLELLLSQRALRSVAKAVLPALGSRPPNLRPAPTRVVQVLLGESFLDEKSPASPPRRAWVRFEATDGSRLHRLDMRLTLCPTLEQTGYYEAPADTFTAALDACDAEAKLGGYEQAPVLLRRRVTSPWPKPPDGLLPVEPEGSRVAISCNVFDPELLGQAFAAAEAVGASVVVQWPVSSDQPMRLDVARSDLHFTAWVMPRNPHGDEIQARELAPIFGVATGNPPSGPSGPST